MKPNQRGFTLVEVMIVVAIIALLAAIAIPNLLRAKVSANDAVAKSTLKMLATAAEHFTVSNSGNYPSDITSLTGANPPYINSPYCFTTQAGYTFDCTFSAGSYNFTATPMVVGKSGTTTWTMTTGVVLTP